jgi:hypothetical protein
MSLVMEKEEEGLPEGIVGSVDVGSEGYVEARYRLHGATVRYNRLGRMVQINAWRDGSYGSFHPVEGVVTWGEDLEIEGVLYGQPDQLWQHGALFG